MDHTQHAGHKNDGNDLQPCGLTFRTDLLVEASRTIDWNGNDDPTNPKNWPLRHKWTAVVIVSVFSFVAQLATSMINPALPHMQKDLEMPKGVLTQMMFSIYLLGYGLGPFMLSPLSEVFGRVIVLRTSNMVFFIFTLACGFAQTGSQMLAFRFIAGFGGSAATSVGAGTIGDTFTAETRATAVSVYTAGPLVAPAIGPVLGGIIAQHTTWRWIFWIVAIVDAVALAAALALQRETWAPVLLERKLSAVRLETGDTTLVVKGSTGESLSARLRRGLVRPIRLLATQPIVILLALYIGYIFGISYLVSSSFATLWTDRYGQSTQASGLHYLALAIGNIVGAQASRINDKIYVYLKAKNDEGRPEYRIPSLIPCAILLPAGLLWYGWSAQVRLFWIMPDIGASLISTTTLIAYCGVQTYVIDTYTKYAASAIAAIALIRSLAGFTFPLCVLTIAVCEDSY